ncbi:MAG: prepilin-type N-terminal cleavage/methylation domain-containing protein [Candidatus Rifleibacteriota bacterium]
MTRKGFTLIELMIVVAIIAIIVEAFWAPIRVLTGLEERRQETLDYNQRLLSDFLKLKKINLQRKEIKSSDQNSIVFNDGAKLILDKGSSCIAFYNGSKSHVFKSLKFTGNLEIAGSRTYIIPLKIDKNEIKSWWRCGK